MMRHVLFTIYNGTAYHAVSARIKSCGGMITFNLPRLALWAITILDIIVNEAGCE
jgi:hypothetical protein